MTVHLHPLPSTEYEPAAEDSGLGTLRTDRGNLPLETIDVEVTITGLTARVDLRQVFRNPYGVPLEATYVFPLPDRAAVTAMRMEADGRVIVGVLRERGRAREDYERAIDEGRRASIAEEERPDVFTMRVGNILPGERVTVRLSLAQPLPYADGTATFRFPLVVAPRYVPGDPLGSEQVGAGWAPDTDAVPDASRISPPVLLPGFPHPVQLSIGVRLQPGGLQPSQVRSSLHAVHAEGSRLRIHPGERADRDFVLRLGYGEPEAATEALLVTRDAPAEPGDERGLSSDAWDHGSGTFQLTVLPPTITDTARPRDVVLVLDRSGSMGGWKIVAARRAAARIVDTLTGRDRFAVLTFDNTAEFPTGLAPGLVEASDRNRYRAVEHLARVQARGGTEMLAPLTEAVALLAGDQPDRERVLVLVTDGQIGNEDQVLAALAPALAIVTVHTVGIDRAVNAGFLSRLAVLGGGRCELVESEDRLDEAAEHIHRRICAPLVTDLRLESDGFELVPDSVAPARLPAIFPGVPFVITGRWRGDATGALTLTGRTPAGSPWRTALPAVVGDASALGPVWARAHLRDLEDRYLATDRSAGSGGGSRTELERRIVATSLRFGVLCRFTAYVAIDTRVVTDGGRPHRVVQPVEPASGWDLLGSVAAPAPMAAPAPSVHLYGVASDTAADGDIPARRGRAGQPPSSGLGPVRPTLRFGAPESLLAHPAADAPGAPDGSGGGSPAGPEIVAGGSGPGVSEPGIPWLGRAPMPATGTAGPLPPSPPSPDRLAWARAQAGLEAQRLREASTLPGSQRAVLLADLGSRLTALLLTLARQGVPEAWTTPLRELADALRAPRPDQLDALWQRALATLDAFAASQAQHPAGPVGRRRGAFWKGR
jgi:Ca-activated chloride channel family protein